MKRLLALALMASLALASTAYAIDLDSAKAQGLVGEQRDGYLGIVSGGSDVQALVDSINAKRREEYTRIASGNGQPLTNIERLAASKAIDMTLPGHYVQDAGGTWIKK